MSYLDLCYDKPAYHELKTYQKLQEIVSKKSAFYGVTGILLPLEQYQFAKLKCRK